jgi:hypothetical protein
MAVEPESIERSFAVIDTGDLVLSNIAGTVEIRGWDRDEIDVKATKRPGNWLPWGSPEEAFRATRIDIEQHGQRVSVKTSRQSDGGFAAILQWLGGVAQVDYVVRVPRSSNVLVDLVSGRLSVEDVQGNLIIRTVSARQELRSLAGNLVISTVSGGVAAEGIHGKASVRTVSGAVRISRGQLVSLTGRTVSGGIDVETPLDPTGPYDFESVTGGVRLAVPASTALSAEHESLSGWLRSELPAEIHELRRGQWRAEVGGGGVRVRVKSVSGGLRIAQYVGQAPLGAGVEPGSATEAAWMAATQAAPAPSPSPAPAATPRPPSDELQGDKVDRESLTMMILEAVQRGELTVEEAGKRLEQLDALLQAEAQSGPPPSGQPGPSATPNG